MAEAQNIVAGLLAEIDRVTEHVLPHYDEIPEGKLGALLIRADIARAKQAIAAGDAVAMIGCYQSLKDTQG